MNIGRLNGQLPAFWHCVAGVHREVDDCDFELVRVGESPPQPAGKHRFNCYVLTEGAAQEIGHAGDEATDIDRLWLERLLPREGEQPLCKGLRPPGPAHRALRGALEPASIQAVLCKIPLQRFEIA